MAFKRPAGLPGKSPQDHGDPRHYLPPAPKSVNRLASLPPVKLIWARAGKGYRIAKQGVQESLAKPPCLFNLAVIWRLNFFACCNSGLVDGLFDNGIFYGVINMLRGSNQPAQPLGRGGMRMR